jgi:hypothetical protein
MTTVKPNIFRTSGVEKGLDPYVSGSSRHKMKNKQAKN